MKNALVYIKVMAAIFLWAGTATAGKILTQHMDPMTIALIRFGVSAVLLFLFLVGFKKVSLPRLSKRAWIDIFFIALIGLYLHNYLILSGIVLLPAVQTNIILATTPIFVSIGAALFMNEHISKFNWIGILITIFGSIIVITNGHMFSASLHANEIKGIIYLVVVMIIWTVYMILTGDYPERLGMAPFMLYTFFISTVLFAISEPFTSHVTMWSELNTKDILCIIFFVISTLFPYIWFFEGVQKIGPSQTTIFTNLMPVFGILQAIIILKEQPSLYFYIGTCITIIGIFFVNKKTNKPAEQIKASTE